MLAIEPHSVAGMADSHNTAYRFIAMALS